MALWNSREEDLRGDINDKKKIEKNGVYEVEVKEAYLQNSTKSKAQAVTISFENEEGYGRISLWYLKGDGTENKISQAKLNRMLFLCKTKVENLKTETKKVKLYSGEEVERTFLPDIHGKNLGMIILAKDALDGNGNPTTNLEVLDFFDIKTQKTAGEIKDNKPAAMVAKKRKEFENALPYETDKKIKTATVEEFNDDEFPF